MKKSLSIILALVTVLSCVMIFASCGDETKYIGVQSGTTGQYYVDGDEDWGFDGLAKYKSKGFSNAGLAISDLTNGGVSYVVVDKDPAVEVCKKNTGAKVVDIALTEEEYAYGVDKAQNDLLASINGVLKNNQTEISAIINKYKNNESDKYVAVESAKLDEQHPEKQLVIATNAAFAPFEYVEGSKYLGIDIEVMKYVADKLGLEVVILDMDFDAVVTSVGKNCVDVAAAALTVNETRKESVNFTDSYYYAAQVVVTKADDKSFDNCKTAEDVVAVLNK